MFNFVRYTLLGISLILTLAFTGLLVLLCIRTHSKGLIVITAVLVFPSTFSLYQAIHRPVAKRRAK